MPANLVAEIPRGIRMVIAPAVANRHVIERLSDQFGDFTGSFHGADDILSIAVRTMKTQRRNLSSEMGRGTTAPVILVD